jgi:hypothetical protein
MTVEQKFASLSKAAFLALFTGCSPFDQNISHEKAPQPRHFWRHLLTVRGWDD